MHSVHGKDGDAVHFNSNGSGDAVVEVFGQGQVRVPFALLVKAVAYVVRAEKIDALEQATDAQIVGLP